MFEPASPASHRPTASGSGRRGADPAVDGKYSISGCVNMPADGEGRRASASLAASWPRLCHDLRTPLNAILGNVELLLDGTAGPLAREARDCAADIQTAAGRMLRHVQALLELCRARSRPALAADGCVDLLAALALVEPLAQGAMPVRFAPAGARFVVRGDPTWLELLASVLVELYLGDGQVRSPLQVSVENDARHGLLRLWWAGIDPHQVPALPLALTAAILDLHDGALTLTPDGALLYWPRSRLA
jgi:signal transduction histidine kinase